jgi:signal transduction histidine kinase/CheY-like chemotaxis protein
MSDDRSPRDGLESDLADLYENAPCAYLSTLGDGTIIRANQTLLTWLNRPRDSVVGQLRFQQLLSVGSQIYYETHYAPLLQMQGVVNEIALEMRRADGSACPVVASARQVLNADGTHRLNRVTLFDSTDRRRYEHELLVARRQAEAAVGELAEADRRKNEFIATLAHELRNPLAPIRAGVEILRRSEDKSAMLNDVTAMMDRQVTQIGRLIEDLLDISRIGQEKLSLRFVPVDLVSVVHHAIEMSEPLLRNAGLTFTVDLAGAPIYISADAARLAQAIGNVLNNASKFTPRGGAVSIALERHNGEALIRVRDTGIGIEPAELSRIFELFAQAKSSLHRPEGLGIGLALARGLVERHGGQVSVHSEGRGRGAEFVIRLPVLAEPPASVRPSFDRGTEHGAAIARRILIVDDNVDSAQAIAMLLNLGGHDVRVAHDGIEAVEACAQFAPHVMLLDIGLPTLSGYEVAERIRQQPGPQPVLVALTGWGQPDDRRRSAVAGFDLHLEKPVDHAALVRLINELAPDAGSQPR